MMDLAFDAQFGANEGRAAQHRQDTAFAERLILGDLSRDLLAKLRSRGITTRETLGQAPDELLVGGQTADLVAANAPLP